MQVFKYLFTALVVIFSGGRYAQLAVSGFFAYAGIAIAVDPCSESMTARLAVIMAVICLIWFIKKYLKALENVKQSRLLPRMQAWYRLKWQRSRLITNVPNAPPN